MRQFGHFLTSSAENQDQNKAILKVSLRHIISQQLSTNVHKICLDDEQAGKANPSWAPPKLI